MKEALWRGRRVKERRAVRMRGFQMEVKVSRVAGKGLGLGLSVVVSRSLRGMAM